MPTIMARIFHCSGHNIIMWPMMPNAKVQEEWPPLWEEMSNYCQNLHDLQQLLTCQAFPLNAPLEHSTVNRQSSDFKTKETTCVQVSMVMDVKVVTLLQSVFWYNSQKHAFFVQEKYAIEYSQLDGKGKTKMNIARKCQKYIITLQRSLKLLLHLNKKILQM